MSAFAKQIATLLAGNMVGSNRKAAFIVKAMRMGYITNASLIAVIWYAAWRKERVAPGRPQFPFPGVKDLKRKFSPDRPEMELDHPRGGGGRGGGTGVGGISNDLFEPLFPALGNAGLTGTGAKVLSKHPELKPGIAKLAEEVLKHFPQLRITSTTGGNHASDSFHYKGRAVDISGPAHVMLQAARWVGENFGSILAEGIHNPSLSIDNKQQVPSSFWGSDTWARHRDHIHLAV